MVRRASSASDRQEIRLGNCLEGLCPGLSVAVCYLLVCVWSLRLCGGLDVTHAIQSKKKTYPQVHDAKHVNPGWSSASTRPHNHLKSESLISGEGGGPASGERFCEEAGPKRCQLVDTVCRF